MINLNPVLSHSTFTKLDAEINNVFKSVPHLPKKVVDVLVKIAPYLVLISGLFMITGGLQVLFGAQSLHQFWGAWTNVPPAYFYFTGVTQIILGLLSLKAYQPLKAKSAEGWQIMLLINLLSFVMNIIGMLFFRQGLFGLLISTLISFYLLYELRASYKKTK